MKSKQVLSIEQMQHLQELGLELDYNTILSWIVDDREKVDILQPVNRKDS